MNLEQFLRLLWPAGDHFFVVEAVNDRVNHHHIQSVEEAVKRIQWRDGTAEGNVYFALASFKQAEYVDAKGKKRRRTQENVDSLKCFWIDMDCKGKGEAIDYPDQIAAVKDILRLCSATGLPHPTVTVNSGYGIHAYWVLDEAISESLWTATAMRWKTTLDSLGIKHDAACTTDSARILRPIETHNRKMGVAEKTVSVIGSVKQTISLSKFTSCLAAGTQLPMAGSFRGSDLSLNDMAMSAVEYRPSSILEVVKNCNLIKTVGKLGGNVSEPIWHRTLGVVKFTVEGAKAIHVFSKGYPGYSFDETVAKAESWSADPTSCAELQKVSLLELPNSCKGCKHAGSIKGPLQLGYPKVMITEQAVTKTATGFIESTVEVSALPVSMDGKFKWENEKLWKSVLDKDATKETGKNVFEWQPFCEFLFYPSSYYRDSTDKHQMVWTLREREGVYKEFEITGGALGAGGQPLFRELGESGVTSMTGGKNHMEAYLTSWGNELKKNNVGIETFMHFGWHGDSFLLGDTMMRPDGSSEKVRVGGGATAMLPHLTPKGDVAEWKRLIALAYDHKGMEHYQFILGLGFGSILVPFMNVAGGMVVSAISYGSGQGKTTAMRNAFGIYGCPLEGTQVTLARSSVTHKGIFATAGVLHNYPIMVDEMTNIEGKELSDIVYTFSQGQPRIGLLGNGELRPAGFGWSGVLLTSSNKPMTGIIAGAKPGADAELARLIEFDCSGVKMLEKESADRIFLQLTDQYGTAAHEYVQWVVSHRDEVKKLLVDIQVMLDKKLGFTSQNRFWSAGYTVCIAGLVIAKRLGLVTFDTKGVVEWCVKQVGSMRGEIVSNTSTPEECFSSILREIGPGLIITDIEGGRGSGGKEAYVVQEPRGTYTGRVITSTGIGYLSQPVVHKWCVDHQVDMKAVIKAAHENGWVVSETAEKRYPGKGTNYAMGQTRCFVLDWERLGNSTQSAPKLAEVVHLVSKGAL